MSVFHNLLMSAAITEGGGTGSGNFSLWSWGYNNIGQLADGTTTNRSSPVQVGALTDWTPNIAANFESIFTIKKDGTLWAWGSNGSGSLGLGDSTNRSSPVQVGSASDWYYVGRGEDTGYAINTSGELYSVGDNYYGELGQGDSGSGTDRSSLTQVGSLTNWAGCTGGNNFTVAVKTDGTSWSWGDGDNGKYFRDSTTDYSSPVQSGSDTDRWGASSYPPAGGWENGVEMQKVFACGYWHTNIIKSDGTLWGAGWNVLGGAGFAGDGDSPTQVGSGTDWEGVSGGNLWGLGIKDGEGLTWGGYNTYGNLGNGTTSSVNGTHYSWGSTVSKASASLSSNSSDMQTAMIIGGELWVAGRNNYGQLGTGNTTDYSSPVQVGSDDNWVKVVCTGSAMIGVKEE
jgi:alpha-tubulin suppressor-like RCC1 family protein